MSRTAEHPARPGTKPEHLPEQDAETIVRERLKTIKRDKRAASDWKDVKARILQQKPRP